MTNSQIIASVAARLIAMYKNGNINGAPPQVQSTFEELYLPIVKARPKPITIAIVFPFLSAFQPLLDRAAVRETVSSGAWETALLLGIGGAVVVYAIMTAVRTSQAKRAITNLLTSLESSNAVEFRQIREFVLGSEQS